MTSRSARAGFSALEVFLVASKLGLTSFGGPVAHLGYFRREYVQRRGWLDEATYAELVALGQSLPGPASSQTGIAIGLLRAGPLGALVAWLGFTWPSALLMFAFAYVDRMPIELGWLFPVLKLVAFVIVALAVWRMARALAWDLPRGALALASAAAVLFAPSSAVQVAVIAVAALLGWRFLPVPATLVESSEVRLVDSFYRSGALVFGGGHVVLPLLHAEVVDTHRWLSEDKFVAGYGAAQLVPGPLFTFAAYLGAATDGLRGTVMATLAIFLPGFLLVFAALPSWGALRARPWVRSALRGINAAVVGLLLAALVGIARAIASTPI